MALLDPRDGCRWVMRVAVCVAAMALLPDDASAMYNSAVGRWMQRDPTAYEGGMSVYQYGASGPSTHLDPLGLREADCGPGCCNGQKDNTDWVNAHIRTLLMRAWENSLAWSPHQSPSGRYLSVWAELAGNVGLSGADTKIEAWLNLRMKDIYNQGVHTYGSAPCMNLCGLCIGTDKIGHMFQQGGTLDIIRRDKGWWYARAFSEYIEGAINWRRQRGGEIYFWLMNGRLTVPGLGWQREPIWDLYRKYGGRYLGLGWLIPAAGVWGPGIWLERSYADHMANLQGMGMWSWLRQHWNRKDLPEFDICDFLSDRMQDTTARDYVKHEYTGPSHWYDN